MQLHDDDPAELKEDDDSARITEVDYVCLLWFHLIIKVECQKCFCLNLKSIFISCDARNIIVHGKDLQPFGYCRVVSQ